MSTEAEIIIEIAEWKAAKTSILTLGQEYTINTSGTSRTIKQAELGIVKTTINELENELAAIQGLAGTQIRPGW